MTSGSLLEERAVLAGLAVAKRRADWRLGRWTAKSLVAAVLDVPVHRIEVRAADDGAPDAFVDGAVADWSLSLSHRDGVAVAAIASRPTRVGIDLETLETRSDAFVREWLSSDEQAALPPAGQARDLQVLCCWTGKEASAKLLREGLRLDVRQAVVTAGPSRGHLDSAGGRAGAPRASSITAGGCTTTVGSSPSSPTRPPISPICCLRQAVTP